MGSAGNERGKKLKIFLYVFFFLFNFLSLKTLKTVGGVREGEIESLRP